MMNSIVPHKMDFVTFSPSPGSYVTDVYRNGVRLFCGPAFASPDVSLITTIQAILEDRQNFRPQHFAMV